MSTSPPSFSDTALTTR